jgi:hypothetical protein
MKKNKLPLFIVKLKIKWIKWVSRKFFIFFHSKERTRFSFKWRRFINNFLYFCYFLLNFLFFNRFLWFRLIMTCSDKIWKLLLCLSFSFSSKFFSGYPFRFINFIFFLSKSIIVLLNELIFLNLMFLIIQKLIEIKINFWLIKNFLINLKFIYALELFNESI